MRERGPQTPELRYENVSSMSQKLPHLSHLREIGWSYWDPIGLDTYKEDCADEYDAPGGIRQIGAWRVSRRRDRLFDGDRSGTYGLGNESLGAVESDRGVKGFEFLRS